MFAPRLSAAPIGIIACLLAACRSPSPPQTPAEASQTPIDGAWRIVSAQTVTDTGAIGETIQESLVHFANGYYTIAYAVGEEPAAANVEPWNGTDEEQLARMSSIVVNAGTYDVSGTTVVTRPLFALVPEYVGGMASYEFEMSERRLILRRTKLESANGVPHPSIARGEGFTYTLERAR